METPKNISSAILLDIKRTRDHLHSTANASGDVFTEQVKKWKNEQCNAYDQIIIIGNRNFDRNDGDEIERLLTEIQRLDEEIRAALATGPGPIPPPRYSRFGMGDF